MDTENYKIVFDLDTKGVSQEINSLSKKMSNDFSRNTSRIILNNKQQMAGQVSSASLGAVSTIGGLTAKKSMLKPISKTKEEYIPNFNSLIDYLKNNKKDNSEIKLLKTQLSLSQEINKKQINYSSRLENLNREHSKNLDKMIEEIKIKNEEQINDFNEKQNVLKKELSTSVARQDAYVKINEASAKVNSELAGKNSSLTKENKDHLDDLRDKRTYIKNLEVEVNSLENRNATLDAEIKKLRSEKQFSGFGGGTTGYTSTYLNKNLMKTENPFNFRKEKEFIFSETGPSYNFPSSTNTRRFERQQQPQLVASTDTFNIPYSFKDNINFKNKVAR